MSLLFLTPVVAAAEPFHLSFVIHGRPSLHPQPAGTPGYGSIHVAVYEGEPVILTVTAHNPPPGETSVWLSQGQWTVTTEAGELVPVKLSRDTQTAVQAPYAHRLLRNTSFANLRMEPLPPGRYIVSLSWTDAASGEKQTARREGFAVYRGDETPVIRAWFLRDRARAELAKGTRGAYEAARAFFLEAAKDHDDPSFYEELADVSLPWAQPAQSAAYYERAVTIARMNLEKKHGQEREWPETARQLYRQRVRKAEAFRLLVPEYAMKFDDLRVVVDHRRGGDVFVMERRSDGKRLRVVDPEQ